MRVVFFGFVGTAWLAHWLRTRPTTEETAAQSEWFNVLFFSGLLSLLAFAIPLAAGMARARGAASAATVAAGAALVAGIANLFEDGLGIRWMFYATAIATLVLLLALLTLAVTLVFRARGGERTVALVPFGALTGVVFYVAAGGPILFTSWLLAALLALRFTPGR
jgi:hypothetical protein